MGRHALLTVRRGDLLVAFHDTALCQQVFAALFTTTTIPKANYKTPFHYDGAAAKGAHDVLDMALLPTASDAMAVESKRKRKRKKRKRKKGNEDAPANMQLTAGSSILVGGGVSMSPPATSPGGPQPLPCVPKAPRILAAKSSRERSPVPRRDSKQSDAVPALPPAFFATGSMIVLHSLSSRADLNGETASVLSLDKATGRYAVQLCKSHEKLRVLPASMKGSIFG